MSVINETGRDGFNVINDDEWPGIDSKFRLIVVAALRSKQLLRGSVPRIEVDLRRHKTTSLALEEVKRGLVPFTITAEEQQGNGNGHDKLRISE